MRLIIFFCLAALLSACGHRGYYKSRSAVLSDVHIKMSTDSGDVVLRLYDSTPLHRDNFVRLVRTNYFDSLLFHRVIKGFMIQGGNPDSKYAAKGNKLGDGGDDLKKIDAEIRPYYINKRGALAAARDNNPAMASSPVQFYIVQGRKFDAEALERAEKRRARPFSEEEKKIYQTEGGAPWLDGKYTVFGEVLSGMDVVDKIAAMPTDANNRPWTDIRMHMSIISAKNAKNNRR